MKNKEELVKEIYLGVKNPIVIMIYGKNLDDYRPSFSFKIKFSNKKVLSWSECSENYGGFEYATQEDAVDGALDFLVDHASFQQIDQENMKRRNAIHKADLNDELNDFEIEDPNPEDNIEEIPEDFRLDLKK